MEPLPQTQHNVYPGIAPPQHHCYCTEYSFNPLLMLVVVVVVPTRIDLFQFHPLTMMLT